MHIRWRLVTRTWPILSFQAHLVVGILHPQDVRGTEGERRYLKRIISMAYVEKLIRLAFGSIPLEQAFEYAAGASEGE